MYRRKYITYEQMQKSKEWMQKSRKEIDVDPWMVDKLPDGGDGITSYPQDGAGGVVSPDQMPDYEEPEKEKEINYE